MNFDFFDYKKKKARSFWNIVMGEGKNCPSSTTSKQMVDIFIPCLLSFVLFVSDDKMLCTFLFFFFGNLTF